MIRVLIADDQKQVREGFRLLLRREPDLEVVEEARDGQEAVDLAKRVKPDVVTMDIKMPRMDGLEATRRVRVQPSGVRVLVVAMSWEDTLVWQALDCGASGYVAKTDAFRELVPAIRTVHQGARYFSQELASWRSLDGMQNPQ